MSQNLALDIKSPNNFDEVASICFYQQRCLKKMYCSENHALERKFEPKAFFVSFQIGWIVTPVWNHSVY